MHIILLVSIRAIQLRWYVKPPKFFFKVVGSWGFQNNCAGFYNLPLTFSIPIPLVQTYMYCTCLTELNPGTKNVSFQMLKGFCRTIFWGGRFLKPKSSKFERFHSFCIIKEISSILICSWKLLYYTNSWGLRLIQK
jgi:hypothetical protein